MQTQDQTLLEIGRATHPQIACPGESFLAYLEGRSADPERAADLYLAWGCAQADPAALAALMDSLRRQLQPLLARFDPSPAFADDLLQALYVKLFVDGAIGSYNGKGSLRSFAAAAATRMALRLRERSSRPAAARPQTAPLLAPELELLKAQYRPQVEECLRDELTRLPDRARSLLRMHYVQEVALDRLARMFHVSRSTLARELAQARRTLLERTQSRLQDLLGLGALEARSLLRLVRSTLHISLDRALAR